MANINTNTRNERVKGRQKKQQLRVDFTPMVDMNMLLITFFMFCTTLSKMQTMEINMPTKEGEGTEFEESLAITILLGAEDRIYYYLGRFTPEKAEDPDFVVETDFSPTGLRSLLLSRNTKVNNQIEELKVQKLRKEITEEEFKSAISEIKKNEKKSPQILIKPTENAKYENLINTLDEIQVCNIGVYAVVDISDSDKYLLYQKTGNPLYAGNPGEYISH